MHTPHLTTAIGFYEQALHTCEELNDWFNSLTWSGNLANAHRQLGELDKAIESFRKALSIAQRIGDQNKILSLLDDIGHCYATLGIVDPNVKTTKW